MRNTHEFATTSDEWSNRRSQSFEYLDKHRAKLLSDDSYHRIMQTIGSQTIEGFFASEESVLRMIEIENGVAKPQQIIDTIIRNYGSLQIAS